MSQTTTPSGADVLEVLGIADAHTGSRAFGHDGPDRDEWEDYVEVPTVKLAEFAALIARNAELEAERNMLGQAIADAAHKGGITRVDAALDGPMLLMVCDDLATHADALAADNKALREVREAADRLQSKLPQTMSESHFHARDELRDLRAALARTPAATTKGNDND